MSLGLGRFKDSRHIGRSVGLGFVIQLWDTSESSTDFSFTAVSDYALKEEFTDRDGGLFISREPGCTFGMCGLYHDQSFAPWTVFDDTQGFFLFQFI